MNTQIKDPMCYVEMSKICYKHQVTLICFISIFKHDFVAKKLSFVRRTIPAGVIVSATYS